uniref:Uncharacterized protein n=1 Tax=Saccharum spontaneum TaxID=62335 RepID=A0A678THQ8_SACSP|nr:hypothetical protein LOC103644543 [Saccharum spontaneum]
MLGLDRAPFQNRDSGSLSSPPPNHGQSFTFSSTSSTLHFWILNTSIEEMPKPDKSSKPRTVVGIAFTRLLLPIGVLVPMCYCSDPCRVAISNEETYKQSYWMCDNYTFDPTPRQIRIGLLDPPPVCDFEEWIDTEIKEKDKEYLRKMKEWEVERKELPSTPLSAEKPD